jgi:beta-glucosidase/6-phospho-beta-glucosidase/beta-galactosidase
MATAESFLEIIQRKSQYRRESRPQNGSGFPTGLPGNFMFATGIECSYPTINQGKTRRDQLAECGHYTHWRKDLQLVKDLGLKVLRYGLPYYSVHAGPGKYDWSFADEVMGEMKKLKITPILDLMHFGLPDWLGDFQNHELPAHFADYADAVSKRYPWVRFYTPVNEMYITARASAKDGIWNEQLKSDKAFVTAMKHVAAACILAISRIARNRPDCVIVQSETAEFIHDLRAVPSEEIKLQNKLRFLSLDLLYAHAPDADVCLYLMDNGLSRKEYNWFMTNSLPCYQVMGNDYYGRNEKIALPDGSMCEATDVMGWYQITRKYYDRYKGR